MIDRVLLRLNCPGHTEIKEKGKKRRYLNLGMLLATSKLNVNVFVFPLFLTKVILIHRLGGRVIIKSSLRLGSLKC